MDSVQERIKAQERKYRIITTQLIEDCFNEERFNLKIQATPINCFVDLRFTAYTENQEYTYDVEVKEYNNTNFDSCILKEEKLKRMIAERHNQKLMYLVFRDGIAYMFNIDSIDFSKIEKKVIKNKVVQFDPNSPYKDELLYFIPLNMAVLKKNAKKYYETYLSETD